MDNANNFILPIVPVELTLTVEANHNGCTRGGYVVGSEVFVAPGSKISTYWVGNSTNLHHIDLASNLRNLPTGTDQLVEDIFIEVAVPDQDGKYDPSWMQVKACWGNKIDANGNIVPNCIESPKYYACHNNNKVFKVGTLSIDRSTLTLSYTGVDLPTDRTGIECYDNPPDKKYYHPAKHEWCGDYGNPPVYTESYEVNTDDRVWMADCNEINISWDPKNEDYEDVESALKDAAPYRATQARRQKLDTIHVAGDYITQPSLDAGLKRNPNYDIPVCEPYTEIRLSALCVKWDRDGTVDTTTIYPLNSAEQNSKTGPIYDKASPASNSGYSCDDIKKYNRNSPNIKKVATDLDWISDQTNSDGWYDSRFVHYYTDESNNTYVLTPYPRAGDSKPYKIEIPKFPGSTQNDIWVRYRTANVLPYSERHVVWLREETFITAVGDAIVDKTPGESDAVAKQQCIGSSDVPWVIYNEDKYMSRDTGGWAVFDATYLYAWTPICECATVYCKNTTGTSSAAHPLNTLYTTREDPGLGSHVYMVGTCDNIPEFDDVPGFSVVGHVTGQGTPYIRISTHNIAYYYVGTVSLKGTECDSTAKSISELSYTDPEFE